MARIKRKFKILGALVVLLLALLLGLIYSGWFLAQAARTGFTRGIAEKIAPIVPQSIRAYGYGIAVKSDHPAVRQEAERVLDEIEPESRDSVTRLIKRLTSNDETERRSAAEELGKIGDKARDAAPQLVEALRDRSESVRVAAADALARVRARGDETIPALKEALNDNAEKVRQAARNALEKLGVSSKDPDVADRDIADSLEQE